MKSMGKMLAPLVLSTSLFTAAHATLPSDSSPSQGKNLPAEKNIDDKDNEIKNLKERVKILEGNLKFLTNELGKSVGLKKKLFSDPADKANSQPESPELISLGISFKAYFEQLDIKHNQLQTHLDLLQKEISNLRNMVFARSPAS